MPRNYRGRTDKGSSHALVTLDLGLPAWRCFAILNSIFRTFVTCWCLCPWLQSLRLYGYSERYVTFWCYVYMFKKV